MIAKDPGTFPVSSIPQSAYPEGSPSVLPSVISFRAGSKFLPPSLQPHLAKSLILLEPP